EERGVASAPAAQARAANASIPAAADAEVTPNSRPRLSRTVTLGQSDADGPPPGEQARTANGPNVSVTINNYGQVGTPAYASYYSGYAGVVGRGRNFGAAATTATTDSGGRATGASRSGASVQPGQNWPAVADHGTSFPYRSAPASPWR